MRHCETYVRQTETCWSTVKQLCFTVAHVQPQTKKCVATKHEIIKDINKATYIVKYQGFLPQY